MLPKKNRLSSDLDYKRVRRLGKICSCPLFVIQFLETKRDSSRFGIITSTKLAKKAVERNKIKRIIREIIRVKFEKIKPGYDVVIIPRVGIKKVSFNEILSNLLRLFKQGGVV